MSFRFKTKSKLIEAKSKHKVKLSNQNFKLSFCFKNISTIKEQQANQHFNF